MITGRSRFLFPSVGPAGSSRQPCLQTPLPMVILVPSAVIKAPEELCVCLLGLCPVSYPLLFSILSVLTSVCMFVHFCMYVCAHMCACGDPGVFLSHPPHCLF